MKKTDFVATTAIVSVAVLTAYAYPHLPDEVVTHFDVHGHPNGWMSRTTFALFCPLLATVLWSFGRFVMPRISDRLSLPRGVSDGVRHLLFLLPLAIVLGVHLLLLRYAASGDSRMITTSVPLILGAVCLVLSLVLPRVRENPFIGIRVPWLRGAPNAWARTHRIAGYTYFAGFLGCVVSLFLSPTVAPLVALGCLLQASFIPVVYSLWAVRHEVP